MQKKMQIHKKTYNDSLRKNVDGNREENSQI